MTRAERVHLELLARWRHAFDLVGPGPLEPHFEDSRLAVSWLDARGDWADLGSGAGFPGLALAARHPEARVTLVEPRRKRAIFLEEVVAATGLAGLRVLRARAEELPPGAWDGVISRAFRPPAAFLVQARRLLRPGGVAVVLLARQDPPGAGGLELFHVEHYRVGGRRRRAAGYRRL